MVGWADFLAASPWAEEWHFLLGVGVAVLVVYLFRMVNPWIGASILVGAIAFWTFKEFYLDVVLEGASITSGWVDWTWFVVIGMGGGSVVAIPRLGVLILPAVLIAPTILLFAGVI